VSSVGPRPLSGHPQGKAPPWQVWLAFSAAMGEDRFTRQILPRFIAGRLWGHLRVAFGVSGLWVSFSTRTVCGPPKTLGWLRVACLVFEKHGKIAPNRRNGRLPISRRRWPNVADFAPFPRASGGRPFKRPVSPATSRCAPWCGDARDRRSVHAPCCLGIIVSRPLATLLLW
jgi:hypothetical protein